MLIKRVQKLIEGFILINLVVLTNNRVFIFNARHLFPMSLYNWALWRELMLWFVTLLLSTWVLSRDGLLQSYLDRYKKNWLLIAFVGFATISLSWTIYPAATFYQLAVLIFTTLIAGYIGVRYDIGQFINILIWIGCIFATASFLMAWLEPEIGMTFARPYNGAWRGIFWHRNHLGSLMALFNAVFLFKIVESFSKRLIKPLIFNFFFYALTLLLVRMSASATGLILFMLLNFGFFVGWAWVNWGWRLQPIHYYLLAIVSFVAFILGMLNLDYLLGFVNRNSSLTGRIPLWNYLINLVINQRPLIGFGFGAIWNFASFRNDTARLVNWLYAVQIGDNGFIDIFLHLGIVGLILFVTVIILTCIRAIKFAINQRTLFGQFPLLLMGYIVVANITFSLFAEIESFIWMIVVAVLFLTTVNQDFDNLEIEP